MFWQRWCARIALWSLVLGWVAEVKAEAVAAPVRVGLSSSLVQDVPAALLPLALRPFQVLIENQTGMRGDCEVVAADQLAARLAEQKVDVAVFQGYEFAWARLKSPDLVPLVIAVNQQRYLTAHLVVPKKGGVENLAGLKQRSMAVPKGTRGHCHLFLDRVCQAGGTASARHFAQLLAPASAEDALDDVIDGVADSALVDGLGLESYQRRKPGRFGELKVIQQSPLFPAPILAVRPGSFDQATTRRFQDGMQAAAQNPQSRRLLQLWKLTGFEAVPDDYTQVLTDIARAYPPPR